MLNRMTWVICALVLGACSAIGAPDTVATLQTENNGYISEATAIRETVVAAETQVAGTAIAAETLVVEINSVNQQILATVRANETPVTQRIVGAADPAANIMDSMDAMEARGEAPPQFIQTGTSTTIRDSDGCIQSPQIEFAQSTPRIYATIVAFNILAGTPVNVEWSYEGAVVWTESITMQQNAAEICLWFFIEPSLVDFTPGQWSVNLYTGSNRAAAPMTFTLVPDGENPVNYGS